MTSNITVELKDVPNVAEEMSNYGRWEYVNIHFCKEEYGWSVFILLQPYNMDKAHEHRIGFTGNGEDQIDAYNDAVRKFPT